jgi:hypothetical protein
VIEEYMRLDKIIRDTEDSITIAERLKRRGRWNAKWNDELSDLRAKLAATIRERDFLDGALSRAPASA